MCLTNAYRSAPERRSLDGTKFKPHDIEINKLLKKYTPNPILVMIDVEHSVPIFH